MRQKKWTFDREEKKKKADSAEGIQGGGVGLQAVDERMDEGRDVERVPEWFSTCSLPPLLVMLWVDLMARALGGFGGNNDAEGPITSAPADNDDA